MNESETFWISILDELDEPTSDALDPTRIFDEGPTWVTKLGVELITMLMPRVQLRVGDRATPEKIGALVGSNLTLVEASTAAVRQSALEQALKLFSPLLGGFDVLRGAKLLPQRNERFRAALMQSMGRILDRPNDERYRFFRAMTRSMRSAKSSTDAAPTANEKRRLNTIAVYGVTLMNWQTIDKMRSSKEATTFFAISFRWKSSDMMLNEPVVCLDGLEKRLGNRGVLGRSRWNIRALIIVISRIATGTFPSF